jgi:ATP-dependent RNA helicase DDX52/ROK1
VTLFTEEDAERGDLRAIAHVMKNSGCDVPDWMLATGSSDPRLRRRKRKDGREDNPRREAIDPARAAAATARETERKRALKLKDRAARKKRLREEKETK